MNNLKFYRKKKKFTQQDLAKILNITNVQYCRLENEKSTLNIKQLLILCNLYKVSSDELLGIKGLYDTITKDFD